LGRGAVQIQVGGLKEQKIGARKQHGRDDCPYVDFPEQRGSSDMENFFGAALAAELRDPAGLLGLATIADKGELASVHAHLGELAAKIDALRLRRAT
jgi:hypothetical protein